MKGLVNAGTSRIFLPLKLRSPSRISSLRILTRSVELSQHLRDPAVQQGEHYIYMRDKLCKTLPNSYTHHRIWMMMSPNLKIQSYLSHWFFPGLKVKITNKLEKEEYSISVWNIVEHVYQTSLQLVCIPWKVWALADQHSPQHICMDVHSVTQP